MRTFRFWLVLVSLIIILIHLSGHDEYGILLMFSNPLILWIYEASSAFRQAQIPVGYYYVTALLFWFLAGSLIDYLIKRIKHRNRS
ncbi:hypothetical protein [Paenibacillus pinihumi]|uniref:hypothetical protein n=1 Tax=Paenibacillus pinihumi TaxID=669462 RepID=UPI00041B657B|nr:hypothetical protein [Paenibacillus pinihumi]